MTAPASTTVDPDDQQNAVDEVADADTGGVRETPPRTPAEYVSADGTAPTARGDRKPSAAATGECAGEAEAPASQHALDGPGAVGVGLADGDASDQQRARSVNGTATGKAKHVATGQWRRALRRAVATCRKAVSLASTFALLAGIATHLVLLFYTNVSGTEPYRVLSGSMEPTYRTGTTLMVDRGVNKLELTGGQTITYITATGQPPTTHRIVEVVPDDSDQLWYRTQGDANPAPDRNLVHPANVIGVVRSDLDHAVTAPFVGELPLGRWVSFARSLQGIAILFGPAIAGLLIGELRILFGGVATTRPVLRMVHGKGRTQASVADPESANAA